MTSTHPAGFYGYIHPKPKPPRRAPRAARNDAAWRHAVEDLRGAWCRACGLTRGLQCDHVWPRSQGGPSVVENGMMLCREHHEAKTAGTLRLRFDWLDPDQVAWLEDVGWVWFDETGEPCGRGRAHFDPRPPGRTERKVDPR